MLIDAHIHLDLYPQEDQLPLIESIVAADVASVVAVSMDLASSKQNLQFHRHYPNLVHPCFGFHPEQPAPDDDTLDTLINWMRQHADEMVAIGEVGLPYYLRSEVEGNGGTFELDPYLHALTRFIQLAAELDKPIVLHAVYEDAPMVLDLLEQHGVRRAHFHWFKGDAATVARLVAAGYCVSVTPDVCYEAEIQELVRQVPLEQLFVETDGPWPFEGPFAGQPTHPRMMHASIAKIAELKQLDEAVVRGQITQNTKLFYGT
jgi:TatD DNase family protein